ncbi:BrnA antitoxin family protein [Trichormus azollae]
MRLDDEILAWFREQVHQAGGGNYQTLINDAL